MPLLENENDEFMNPYKISVSDHENVMNTKPALIGPQLISWDNVGHIDIAALLDAVEAL